MQVTIFLFMSSAKKISIIEGTQNSVGAIGAQDISLIYRSPNDISWNGILLDKIQVLGIFYIGIGIASRGHSYTRQLHTTLITMC